MSSDLATITQQIAHEYTAAQLGLFGLASGTTRHGWITARQERLGVLHEQLQHIVGEHAIMIVSDTLDGIPTSPTRKQVQQVLRCKCGNTEDSAHLLTLLDAVWAQVDLLSTRVGVEAACKLVSAQPTYTEEVQPS